MQQGEIEQFTPLPDSSTALWSDLEAECFLLGLYIFGKNLNLLSMFLGSKTVGDVLSYYYGKFYKRDAYNRWSDCRKARTRRCILGEHIFTGWRQQELISRLKSKILKEAHDSLVEVFKSFSDGQTSLEDFVFALKSTVGTEAFVEAVGIGKGKHDLTGFVLDPSKPNQVCSVHPDMTTGKYCSSLASEDIIKFLTGDFRRSRTRSIDLFREAVWPRLLARGWHSEQPKDVSTTKNWLVFLVPGIKKFSSNLTKGTHYFDSISDVLKRVAADPVLLELEVDGMNNGVTSEKNGCTTDMKLNIDGPFDGFQELPKFTIIDTSLVQGEEPFKVRELRNLPADANISFAPSHRSHNMVSASSSEEQDPDARSSNEQEDCGRVTADANDIEMVSAYNTGKGNRVPHPKNIPNMGDIFDNERLEKVWWNRVEEIDELKDPTRVFSMFARTSINEVLEQIATVGEYHRQLMQLRQQKAELCEQTEKWFKSVEKSLADALDHEKVETQRLRDENLDLMRKLQEANSAALDLHSKINNKEVEIGKFKTEINEKALVVLELSRSAKEKDQVIKSWEEQTAKKDASHDNEIKQLDSRLAEQAVEIKCLHEAASRSQEEMKSMKINLQDNISLLNNVLRGLGVKEVTHLEDTMIAHTSAIGEQVGVVEELITTLKANQVDSLRGVVEGAVGYALAKLKAHDRNLNLQPIEDDFDCSEA